MKMSDAPMPARQIVFWLAVTASFLFLIHALGTVLMPFVLGIVIAYFLDPVCNRLSRLGFPRWLATATVLALFVLVTVAVFWLVVPLLVDQAGQFIKALPGYIEHIRAYLEPKLHHLMSSLSDKQVAKMQETVESYVGDATSVATSAASSIAQSIWQGGLAVVDIISLLIITPIVAFYMLRDWHYITSRVNSLLPLAHAETIRTQISEIDRTLAAFIRGQATVCVFMGTIYAVSLSLVGINFGAVIGLVAGLLSFIPFVGTGFGLIVASTIALVQFDGYTHFAIVLGIFLVVHLLEGNVITPKFVGESVGLHPVWIIFALMAGGSLMGFTGMLLAVPVAAVTGVLVRFSLGRYLESPYYYHTNQRKSQACSLRRIKPL